MGICREICIQLIFKFKGIWFIKAMSLLHYIICCCVKPYLHRAQLRAQCSCSLMVRQTRNNAATKSSGARASHPLGACDRVLELISAVTRDFCCCCCAVRRKYNIKHQAIPLQKHSWSTFPTRWWNFVFLLYVYIYKFTLCPSRETRRKSTHIIVLRELYEEREGNNFLHTKRSLSRNLQQFIKRALSHRACPTRGCVGAKGSVPRNSLSDNLIN